MGTREVMWALGVACWCGGVALAADEGGLKLNAACQLERMAADPGVQVGRGLGFSIGGFSFGGGRRGRGESGPGLSLNEGEILRDALRPEKSDVLAAEGPRFESVFRFSCLPIQALVRGEWPLLIDYQLEEGTVATLEIHLPGRDPVILPLPGGFDRQAQTLLLPANLGEGPQAAVLLFRALIVQSSPPVPGRFVLFGLAAGPRVLEMPIPDELVFQPGEIHLGAKDQAHFGFHGRTAFKRAAVDILNVDEREGTTHARLARSYPVAGGIAAETRTGEEPLLSWNGTLDDKQVSLGPHKLQVRAWSSLEDGGDWAVAWSSDVVRVKP